MSNDTQEVLITVGKDAVPPHCGTIYSTGYDLTIVSVDKKINSLTTRYDTQVCVQPPEGYYTEILPRSSLSSSGYMLTNSVGIIDEDYRGPLKIVLTKIVPDAPDIKLPFTCCQLILRKREKFTLKVVDKLSSTERGDGGFGSTSK